MGLSSIVGVQWSDWVIRLPGGGGSPEATLLLILIAVALAWAVVRGTSSIAEKVTPALWSLVSLVAVILVILVIGRINDGRSVGSTVERDGGQQCADQLLSRCPPSP
jgi:hypothetical protein